MDLFEKLHKRHFFQTPREYIYAQHIVQLEEYEKLYENCNNLNHNVWKDFDKKYRLGFEFYEDVGEIDTKRDVTCLWFFRDRNDRDAGNDITLVDKKIPFKTNIIFITPHKLTFNKREKFFIRRPCLQIDMNKEMYVNIKKRLGYE